MVDAIVSFAVEKLGNFLVQEIGLPQRLRNDLEWLKTELVYMQSFLADAGQKRSRDHRVEMWVSEIRNVADDAVDIIEKFNRNVGSNTGGSKCRLVDCIRMYACICSKEADLHNMAEKIESIKASVLEISRKRETYGITSINGAGDGPSDDLSNRSMMRRRATSYADDEEELFVGFEDVFGTLLNVLLKGEPQRRVISIYGMGGLGKTTLARQLYNDGAVKRNFPHRAWVCVSQDYSTQDLLRTIIKSFKKGCSRKELKMLEKMDETDLERFLREFLKEHRYLVVVDDVWHKEAWYSLKRAFPESKNGSRVIVTTRIKEVAERVDDRTIAQELRFLSPEESRDLFYKKISQGEGHANWCSAAMLDLGMAMVDKCGGLPLAIIVLGGLLSHKKGLEEWRTVKNHIWRHVKNDSVEIKYILSLSYNDLSDELKQCFLYLGLFPEDYVVNTEKLIWLWMAEELIPPGEEEMEDIAKDFLQELNNRSLIQKAEWFRGISVGYRVHDLLRDLAVEKAIQVNFFGIYDPRKHSTPCLRPRHAVHTQIQKYFSSGLSNSHVRSIIVFNPDNESIKIDKLKSSWKNFRYLRVLDLEGVHIDENDFGLLPEAIGDLVHLKYFGLPYTSAFHELPSSIGNLKNLQTLQALTVNGIAKIFPREISKLINLIHLSVRPRGLFQFDTLTNLRTLRYVRYDQWVQNNVINLINLRELAIEEIYDAHGKAYSLDNIGKLNSLESLFLKCSRGISFPSLEPLSSCQNLLRLKLEGRIEKLPAFHELPQSLTMLTLSYSELKEDPMPILERLPNLTNLLLERTYNGDKMTCHGNGFPQLEFLYLSSLYNLEELQLDKEAMPILRGLEIMYCPKLIVPDRLKSIPGPKDSLNRVSNAFQRISECYPYF